MFRYSFSFHQANIRLCRNSEHTKFAVLRDGDSPRPTQTGNDTAAKVYRSVADLSTAQKQGLRSIWIRANKTNKNIVLRRENEAKFESRIFNGWASNRPIGQDPIILKRNATESSISAGFFREDLPGAQGVRIWNLRVIILFSDTNNGIESPTDERGRSET